ncbi:hypothetical protein MnTg01_01045 [archaeon MnTg01]|nr:hypothetical protein MnTg01_01045 [archaeon MnTg01]
MSSKDQILIAGLMESFISDAPTKPFVSFCVFCNKGVVKDAMTYQKGKVFHKDCYDKHGSSFPAVNHELLSQSSNTKVQLVQLKNLKVRTMGTSNPDSIKRKTKKLQPKRKRTVTKRRTSKRKPSKKRRVAKRRTTSKRKKTTRKTKRRASRMTKRKARRR